MQGKKSRSHAAGFVIISSDLRRVFTLFKNGVADLPKGLKEIKESSLQTALREAFEESGAVILDEDIVSILPYNCDGIDFFVAVKDFDPIIKPNPNSGFLEHDGFKWLEWKKAFKTIPRFMRPAIEYGWAISNTLLRPTVVRRSNFHVDF